MGLGSYTNVRLKGPRKDLEKIYEYTHDADEGDFYLRTFHISNDEFEKMTDDEVNNFLVDVGVNSMCQASCNSKFDGDELVIDVYSTYETPIGCWNKIAGEFPEVYVSFCQVSREDAYEDGVYGDFIFEDGEASYYTPEDAYYDWYSEDGEDEEDDE